MFRPISIMQKSNARALRVEGVARGLVAKGRRSVQKVGQSKKISVEVCACV